MTLGMARPIHWTPNGFSQIQESSREQERRNNFALKAGSNALIASIETQALTNQHLDISTPKDTKKFLMPISHTKKAAPQLLQYLAIDFTQISDMITLRRSIILSS
ncbi:hypothetical protein FF011L_51620 [Roseimaritima multifibrata]|uniref:Uncharacterized protein n=1 Tax=Roseimaritima multifibrata TaxID=1930274 RepID=A0A517MNA7_9BACT|nr:hypothetical protein FF011L_51620 [Roseimaritima multifibrata]